MPLDHAQMPVGKADLSQASVGIERGVASSISAVSLFTFPLPPSPPLIHSCLFSFFDNSRLSLFLIKSLHIPSPLGNLFDFPLPFNLINVYHFYNIS